MKVVQLYDLYEIYLDSSDKPSIFRVGKSLTYGRARYMIAKLNANNGLLSDHVFVKIKSKEVCNGN